MSKKQTAVKVLLAAALTEAYGTAAVLIGILVIAVLAQFLDTVPFYYITAAAIGAVTDILLFKPLCRLFKNPVWVYVVQSGNLYSLFLITTVLGTYGSAWIGLADFFIGVFLSFLLGGTAINFIYQTIRLTCSGKAAEMKKILVGMSGGVDSSAAALLLKNRGYEVSGCTLELCGDSEGNVSDAKAVCDKLGIPHYVFDMRELFREKVTDEFAESYINGETPNPCVNCNRHIKFGAMLDKALEMGFDGIATGHYAEARFDEKSGKYLLTRPADRKKDQTYFLYNLTQEQLARTLFPLCELSKEDIRRLAEEHGLVNARRPDSQDICFVPDGDYAGFIEKHKGITFPEGDFVDTKGNVIGRHSGLIRYTVGQRKGLGAAFGKPVFVCGKNVCENTVVLGEEADLFKTELLLADVNIISGEKISAPLKVTAKTRYSAKEQPAEIYPEENGLVKIKFGEPVKAPAAGQACVFYDGDTVIGGGKIIHNL